MKKLIITLLVILNNNSGFSQVNIKDCVEKQLGKNFIPKTILGSDKDNFYLLSGMEQYDGGTKLRQCSYVLEKNSIHEKKSEISIPLEFFDPEHKIHNTKVDEAYMVKDKFYIFTHTKDKYLFHYYLSVFSKEGKQISVAKLTAIPNDRDTQKEEYFFDVRFNLDSSLFAIITTGVINAGYEKTSLITGYQVYDTKTTVHVFNTDSIIKKFEKSLPNTFKGHRVRNVEYTFDEANNLLYFICKTDNFGFNASLAYKDHSQLTTKSIDAIGFLSSTGKEENVVELNLEKDEQATSAIILKTGSLYTLTGVFREIEKKNHLSKVGMFCAQISINEKGISTIKVTDKNFLPDSIQNRLTYSLDGSEKAPGAKNYKPELLINLNGDLYFISGVVSYSISDILNGIILQNNIEKEIIISKIRDAKFEWHRILYRNSYNSIAFGFDKRNGFIFRNMDNKLCFLYPKGEEIEYTEVSGENKINSKNIYNLDGFHFIPQFSEEKKLKSIPFITLNYLQLFGENRIKINICKFVFE